jgi:hypothetical protein
MLKDVLEKEAGGKKKRRKLGSLRQPLPLFPE